MTAGLVERPEEWDGLLFWSGGPDKATFERFHQRDYDRALNAARGDESQVDRERFTEAVDVDCAALDAAEIEQINAIIAEGTRELARERGGRPVLGRQGVLRQDVFDAPAAPKRSPMPLCHSSCAEAFVAYRDGWREWVRAFREASAAFRRGVLDVMFPEHAFRPWVPILRT